MTEISPRRSLGMRVRWSLQKTLMSEGWAPLLEECPVWGTKTEFIKQGTGKEVLGCSLSSQAAQGSHGEGSSREETGDIPA